MALPLTIDIAQLRVRDLGFNRVPPLPPLNVAAKTVLIDQLWGLNLGLPRNLQQQRRWLVADDFDPYFDYFFEICENINRANLGVGTYGALLDIIRDLKAGGARTAHRMVLLGQVRHAIVPNPPAGSPRVLHAMHLVIQLWLLVRLGSNGTNVAGVLEQFPRPDPARAGSIDQQLTDEFPRAQAGAVGNLALRFDPNFNLCDMHYLAGFKIKWTHNLLHHLLLEPYYDTVSTRFSRVQELWERSRHHRLSFFYGPESLIPVVFGGRGTTILYIYHNVTVLQALSAGDLVSRLPFAKETIDTIGLLLPNLPHCQTWFEEERIAQVAINERLDPAANTLNSSRKVHDYDFWRARLLLLQDEYEKSGRSNIFTFWRDRRKPRDWFTFWFAVAAFIFAVLSTITGLVSAVYGGLSYKVAADAPPPCPCPKTLNSTVFVTSTSAQSYSASPSSSTTSISNVIVTDIVSTTATAFTTIGFTTTIVVTTFS